MDIAQLRSFLSVAELGSMTKAAEEQFLDVSAMSRRISQLERELRVQLFHRSPTSVELTPKGRALLAAASAAVAGLDAAIAELRAPEEAPTLRILVPPLLSRSARDLVLEAAARSAVPVLLDLVPGRNHQARQRLRGGEAQLAMMHGGRRVAEEETPRTRLVVETTDIGVAVNARAIPPVGLPRLADLAPLSYVTSENEAAPRFHGDVDAALGAAGIRDRMELPRQDLSTMAAIVATRPAFCLCPLPPSDVYRAAFAEDPRIRVTAVSGFRPQLETLLCWQPDMIGEPEHALIDALTALLAERSLLPEAVA